LSSQDVRLGQVRSSGQIVRSGKVVRSGHQVRLSGQVRSSGQVVRTAQAIRSCYQIRAGCQVRLSGQVIRSGLDFSLDTQIDDLLAFFQNVKKLLFMFTKCNKHQNQTTYSYSLGLTPARYLLGISIVLLSTVVHKSQ
jgi:hypothetical protein